MTYPVQPERVDKERRTLLFAPALLATFGWTSAAWAQQRFLVLNITDAADQPIAQVRIGTRGDGSATLSDARGRARLQLAPGTAVGQFVTLQLLAPAGLVIMSPHEGRTPVPSFANASDNYVQIVIFRRGEQAMLQNAALQVAAAARSRRRRRSARAPGWIGGPDTRPRLLPAAWTELEAGPGRPLGLISDDVAAELGFTAAEIEQAMTGFNPDRLAWQTIMLTASVEFGNYDPFSTLFAYSFTGRLEVEFGIGSWGLREGRLQHLLRRMREADSEAFDRIMGDETRLIGRFIEATPEAANNIALGLVEGAPRAHAAPAWKARFKALGLSPKFQHVQMEEMTPWVQRARRAVADLELRSERAFAFAYDMIYQRGRLPAAARIDAAFERFVGAIGRPPDEQEKLLLIANLVRQGPTGLSQRFWQRNRTFALGDGDLNGVHIDLEEYGFGMRDMRSGAPIPLSNDAPTLERLKSGWLPGDSETDEA